MSKSWLADIAPRVRSATKQEFNFSVVYSHTPKAGAANSKKKRDEPAIVPEIKYTVAKNDTLASYHSDRTIRIFDLVTKTVIHEFTTENPCSLLELREVFEMSKKTSRLEPVRLLHFANGKVVNTLNVEEKKLKKKESFSGHKEFVTRYCIDGGYLYTAANDKTLKVFEQKTSKCIGTYEGHTDTVLCFEVVNMGAKVIVSGSADSTLKIWMGADPSIRKLDTKPILDLRGHTNWVYGVKVIGSSIYSASLDDTIREWDLTTGRLIQCFNLSKTAPGFRTDFKIMYEDSIFLCFEDKMAVYSLRVGKTTRTLVGHTGEIKALRLSGDFLFSGSVDKTIRLWNLKDGSCMNVLVAHTGPITSLQLEGQALYSSSEDGSLVKWDIPDLHQMLSKQTKKELIKETLEIIEQTDDFSSDWWLGKMSRQEAEMALMSSEKKVFLLREGSVPGSLALSKFDPHLRVFVHILISKGKQYSLQNSVDQEKYPTLADLINKSPELSGFHPFFQVRDTYTTM